MRVRQRAPALPRVGCYKAISTYMLLDDCYIVICYTMLLLSVRSRRRVLVSVDFVLPQYTCICAICAVCMCVWPIVAAFDASGRVCVCGSVILCDV